MRMPGALPHVHAHDLHQLEVTKRTFLTVTELCSVGLLTISHVRYNQLWKRTQEGAQEEMMRYPILFTKHIKAIRHRSA